MATDPVDRCVVNVGSVCGRSRRLAMPGQETGRRVVGSATADVAEPS